MGSKTFCCARIMAPTGNLIRLLCISLQQPVLQVACNDGQSCPSTDNDSHLHSLNTATNASLRTGSLQQEEAPFGHAVEKPDSSFRTSRTLPKMTRRLRSGSSMFTRSLAAFARASLYLRVSVFCHGSTHAATPTTDQGPTSPFIARHGNNRAKGASLCRETITCKEALRRTLGSVLSHRPCNSKSVMISLIRLEEHLQRNAAGHFSLWCHLHSSPAVVMGHTRPSSCD